MPYNVVQKADEFLDLCLPPGETVQRREMRKAFLVGFSFAVEHLFELAELEEDKAVEGVDDLHKQIQEWVDILMNHDNSEQETN